MPRLSHVGVLVFGIALCVLGALSFLYRPGATYQGTPVPTQPPVFKEPGFDDLPSQPAAIAEAGEKLVRDFKCNYCHRTDLTSTPEHPRENCQHCHQNQAKQIPDHLAPPLNRIAERRPGAWLRRYLRYPYALRTNNASRMPDMGLTDFQVEVAARYLESLAQVPLLPMNTSGPSREVNPDAARLEQGRALNTRFGCTVCHGLGDQKAAFVDDLKILEGSPTAIFAPDLGSTFNRVRPGWLAAAIKHPSRWMPWAKMPENAAMTDAEAETLAYWVMNAVPSPKPTVAYSQIQELFNFRCLSCHYAPMPKPPMSANPEGGAGWLATWSKKPRHFSVEDYEHLLLGSHDDLGRRRPAVVPFALNSPILMHLSGAKHPAMPFGQDPLPADEFKLIESWILSGARGPSKVGGIEISPPLEFEGK